MALTTVTYAAALDAALEAAGRGWHTFPLVGKSPFAGSHGHRDASADPTAIRAAMNNRRAISFGIATGAGSGIVIVDVDDRDALAALEADLGPLPDAPTVITASGGSHIYFAHPGGHVPTTAAKLAIGVDTRGDGGFCVGAGSTLPDGRQYGWECSSHPDDVALPALPARWLAAIQATPARRTAATTDDAAPILEGGRDHALTSIAGRLRRAGLSEAAMRAALQKTNAERCQPPLPDAAVARIAASIARYPAGQSPPLPAPPRAEGATDPDPCADARDALAAARADLAAVRADLTARDDQVATLQERARWQDVTINMLMNPDLGPAAPTAVALVDRLRGRRPDRPDHDASHRVPHAALAARTGRSVDVTHSHVKRLAAMTDPDGAPLFRRDIITVPERVDPETGEIVALHREQFIGTGPVTAEHIALALAVYAAPTKRNHGGARTANPPCPNCGSRHRRSVCSDCGATVNPVAPTVDAAAAEPNRQDAPLAADGPEGAPGVAPYTLLPHLDGLAGPGADEGSGDPEDVAAAPAAPGPLEAAVQRLGPRPAHRATPDQPPLTAATDADAADAADPWQPPSEQHAPPVAVRFGAPQPARYDKYTDVANGRP